MVNKFLYEYGKFFDMDLGLLSFEKIRFIPHNYIINTQKAGTLFAMFFLMCYFDNFSLGAWVYLALHGSYGIFKRKSLMLFI